MAEARMGDLVMTRVMLMTSGISFYELEEKASRDEFMKSPVKSEARSFMISEGISVQDLKKGTIYEVLEHQGWTKEDIEKHLKDMMQAMDSGGKPTVSAQDLKKASIYGEIEKIRGTNGIGGGLSEEALKDMEMFGMTKSMKKAAKKKKQQLAAEIN